MLGPGHSRAGQIDEVVAERGQSRRTGRRRFRGQAAPPAPQTNSPLALGRARAAVLVIRGERERRARKSRKPPAEERRGGGCGKDPQVLGPRGAGGGGGLLPRERRSCETERMARRVGPLRARAYAAEFNLASPRPPPEN